MKHNTSKLPNIPNKRYFTIGEVAHLCGVKPHVLRYWEQEFPQLKPAKRRGNRRYYQRADVVMVRNIRGLLYDEGYTISGARIQLDQVVKQQKQADKEVLSEEVTYSYSFTVDKEDTVCSKEPKAEHEQHEKIEFVAESITESQVTNHAMQEQNIHNNKEHQCKYKKVMQDAIVELKQILSELNPA